jgi:protein SCO1/2
MKRLLSVAALLLCGACGQPNAGLPYYRSADLTPEWLNDAIATSPRMHTVGDFAFADQSAARITRADLTGRVSLVYFFFTKCGGVCPLTQPNIAELLRRVPHVPSFQVLAFSVTPDADSVPQLADYAARHHINDSRWHLLTGSRDELGRLAKESFFVNLTDGKPYGVKSVAHTETVALLDQRGRIRGVYDGTLRLEVGRMEEDVRRLLQ